MADLSDHPDFDLDTALSADLDGELDAYASELGVAPDDLRAVLAGPAGSARREELAAVRAALRTDSVDAAPPLDDLTRRRLLAGAGVGTRSSAPRRHAGRWLRPAAAAAVTLLVLAGVYAIVQDSGGSGGSGGSAAKSSGGSAGSTVTAVTGDLGDVGAVDAAGIAGFLRGEAPERTASSAPAANQSADRSAGAEFAAATPQAVATCADRYASEGTIRFRASGTFQDRPAVVLGIDTTDRTIVFVVAADDCAQVLYSASR
jgi:hypothetical protein